MLPILFIVSLFNFATVFREQVTVIDAIVTVKLMESTFGFGRIIKPYDVIKEELPLGPNNEEIKCILNIL